MKSSLAVPTLLLLGLAGGYLFTRVCHLTRFTYRISREEGHRLIFMLLFWTVPILFLSQVFLSVVSATLPKHYVSVASHAWHTLTGPLYTPALATFVGAFVLGPLLGLIVNLFYGANRASTYVLNTYGGPLEKMLWESMTQGTLLSVTLKNQTVYVGTPMETTVIVSADDLPYLSFLPRLRGYRDENTSELRITDDYTGKLGQIRNELMSEVVSRLREKDPEKISSETFRQALSGLSAMIPVIVIRRDEIALVDTFPIDETLSTFEESSSSRRQNTRDLAYKEASEPRLLRFLLWLFIAWLLRRWT